MKSTANFHFVICGSGPIESMISGCLASNQQKVIILEKNPLFGGFYQTMPIVNFIEYVEKHGKVHTNTISQFLGQQCQPRHFQIDVLPLVLYGNDRILSIIKKSKISAQLNQSLVFDVFSYEQGQGSHVLASKSTIFQDTRISNRDRRHLYRFISTIQSNPKFGHTENSQSILSGLSQLSDKPLSDTLLHFGIPECAIQSYIHFVSVSETQTEKAISRMKKFFDVIDCNVDTPFSTFQFGSSTLSLAFLAYANQLGSQPLTGRFVQGITADNTIRLQDHSELSAPVLLMSPSQFSTSTGQRLIAHRRVTIIAYPFLGYGESLTVIPPGELGNEHPIYMLQLDSASSMCVAGTFILHFWSLSEIGDIGVPAQHVIFDAVFDLFESICDFPPGVIPITYPDVGQNPFGSDYLVDKAEEIVRQICPSAKFYPPPQFEYIDVTPGDSPYSAISFPAEVDSDQSYDSSDIDEKLQQLS